MALDKIDPQALVVFSRRGCTGLSPSIPAKGFGDTWLQHICEYVVEHAREEDIKEWTDFDMNAGRDLPRMLYWAIKNSPRPLVILDEKQKPVAVAGISSGEFLWSFWAKPSVSCLRALVELFPLGIGYMRPNPKRVLRNYIRRDNVFFTKLIKRIGGTVRDAPEFHDDYQLFEV